MSSRSSIATSSANGVDLLADTNDRDFDTTLPRPLQPWWKPRHDRLPIVEVPTGIGVYPKDVAFVPRWVAEKATNLVRWTVMPRGGHYGPSEQPAAAVKELTTFFHSLRDAV